MSETIKEETIVAGDEGENETSQEIASSNDEGSSEYRTRHGTITPPDGSIKPPDKEKYDAAHTELLRSNKDCEGCVASSSSAAEIHEGERGTSISLSERQVNLLEKTRELSKKRQLKERQYDFLKPYIRKMLRRSYTYNWYTRFGEISSQQPKMFEDFPCECDQEEECKTLESSEKVFKEEEEKRTKQESSAEKSNISIQSPTQQFAEHNNTCNAKRVSLYFSCIAEYFIDEEVVPDMFLYVPFSKENCGEDSVDYKYYILQENRKILLLKLKEGLRTKLESWEEEMTGNEETLYKYRNELRIARHNVLKNLLKDLLEPYENLAVDDNDDENSNRNPNPSKETADEIDQDKSRYLLLKAEHQRLKKRLKREAFERRHEELIDDAKSGGYYISYEEFLEQEKSKKNKPSTSKNELEIEKSIGIDHASDEPESKRKMSDSEQEAEEPESKRKKGDPSQETEEPESKIQESDLEQETKEPEGKRKNGDTEQDIVEPESERKRDGEQSNEESEC